METRFQTSFIPKKPMSGPGSSATAFPHHHLSGLVMSIATIIFVCSLLSVGGAYLWKSYLQSAQVQDKADLAAREQQFNISLIEQLQLESAKISLARQVLNSHVAVSQAFGIIQNLTDEYVRFTSLDLTVPFTSGTPITLSLSGYGNSLSTVAFQSDVLNDLGQYGLANVVENPILSNPTQSSNGNVSFSLTATLDPSALSYEKEVTGSAASTPSTPSTASTSVPSVSPNP